MDYEDLRIFDRLAGTLHFGRAANQSSISPSALTRRVQMLEQTLGVTLLARDPRSVRLTAAGEKFRRFAREELDRWEILLRDLRLEEKTPRGELNIACTVTACHTVLPNLLANCRERYPEIALKLVTQDAARSLAQLEANEADLAVIPTDGPVPERLCAATLASTDLVFIAPSDKRARERLGFDQKLRGTTWVAQMAGLERKRLDRWISKNDPGARIIAEVRGNEAIIAMVSLGSGLGLVPRLVLRENPQSVDVLEHTNTPPGYDVSICALRRNLSREAVRAFWGLVEEEDN